MPTIASRARNKPSPPDRFRGFRLRRRTGSERPATPPATRHGAGRPSHDDPFTRPDECDTGPPAASRAPASRSANSITSARSPSAKPGQTLINRESSGQDSAEFAPVSTGRASECASSRASNRVFLGEFAGVSNPAPATDFERTPGFPGVFSFPGAWRCSLRCNSGPDCSADCSALSLAARSKSASVTMR